MHERSAAPWATRHDIRQDTAGLGAKMEWERARMILELVKGEANWAHSGVVVCEDCEGENKASLPQTAS